MDKRADFFSRCNDLQKQLNSLVEEGKKIVPGYVYTLYPNTTTPRQEMEMTIDKVNHG